MSVSTNSLVARAKRFAVPAGAAAAVLLGAGLLIGHTAHAASNGALTVGDIGRAGAFVTALQGSYSGVVGLPLYEAASLLTGLGYRRP